MPARVSAGHRLNRAFFVALGLLGGWVAAACAGPPPAQPTSGSGGSAYKHADVKAERSGEGDDEYWIFRPAAPEPKEAPVVVFLHGWGGVRPSGYGGWIRHLVRNGSVVIFPRFQASLRTPVASMPGNALRAIKAAWSQLEKGEGPRPLGNKFVMIGHSIGGFTGANVAASARAAGLPLPAALLFAAPGNGQKNIKNEKMLMPLKGLDQISADTLMVMVLGDKDRMASDHESLVILQGATAVPEGNKLFLEMHSDTHTDPKLHADHFSPMSRDREFTARADSDPAADEAEAAMADQAAESADASDDTEQETERSGQGLAGRGEGRTGRRAGGRIRERIQERREVGGDREEGAAFRADTLDYYGYWRLSDDLIAIVFHGADRNLVFGPNATAMGKCEDGTAIRPMTSKPIP